MGNGFSKNLKPLKSESPTIAIYGYNSLLSLVNLEGETTNSVKVSDEDPRGIVACDNGVYVVTEKRIYKIHSSGKATPLKVYNKDRVTLVTLSEGGTRSYQLDQTTTEVIAFQNKIYVMQSNGKKMIVFDPGDKTTKDLRGCPLGFAFCSCASDKFIYSVGGYGTETTFVKYDPAENTWSDIEPMRYWRFDSASATMNDRIYVLGGWNNPPPEFYDSRTGSWCEISRMLAHRLKFSACVINNQLYAIGGDGDWGGSSVREHSIEVYDGSQWKLVTKFKSDALAGREEFAYKVTVRNQAASVKMRDRFHFHACVWPHSQYQPGTIEEPQSSRNEEHNQRAPCESRKIGQEGGDIKLSGVEIEVPEGALQEEEDKVKFSTSTVATQDGSLYQIYCGSQRQCSGEPDEILLHHDADEVGTGQVSQENDRSIDVALRLQTQSSGNLTKPIPVKMKTCVSAADDENLLLGLQHRNNPDEEWKEIEELHVGESNEVTFNVLRGGEVKIVLKQKPKTDESPRVKVHAITDFFINTQTGGIAATFSKDQIMHDMTEQRLGERNFVPFSVNVHSTIAEIGSELLLSMECREPTQTRISEEVLPSRNFTLDESFLEKGSHCVYFELDPEPSDNWKKIKIIYGYLVDRFSGHKLPLQIKWPPEEVRKSQTNNYFHAPVGQVTTGNAMPIIHGGVNVEDSRQNIDRSVTAGNMYEGESRINSEGASVTVSRT